LIRGHRRLSSAQIRGSAVRLPLQLPARAAKFNE
jgi:hypothetical protein